MEAQTLTSRQLRIRDLTDDERDAIEAANEMKTIVSTLLTKCRHLVGSFKKSEGLCGRLKVQQIAHDYESQAKLKQDVCTRWNSILAMVQSICNNEEALVSMKAQPANKSIANYVPSNDEFAILHGLCDLLQPINDITVMLRSSSYTSISSVFPAFYYLITHYLPEYTNEETHVETIRDELFYSLEHRFAFVLDSDIYKAATFLDVQYRQLSFIKDEVVKKSTINEAKRCITKIFKDFKIKTPPPPPARRQRNNDSTPRTSLADTTNLPRK